MTAGGDEGKRPELVNGESGETALVITNQLVSKVGLKGRCRLDCGRFSFASLTIWSQPFILGHHNSAYAGWINNQQE